MHDNYDLVVIGSGPGGYVAAIKAAQSGLKVAIIEEKEIGGTCLNRGCVPTKALMHTTHLYKEMSMCEKLGIFTDNISIDVEKMYARKDEVVTQLRSGVEFLIKSNKIEIIQGKGQITGRHRVTVKTQEGDRDLESEYILIATGSVPTVLPIPGHDLPGIITSDEIMKQKGKKYESIIVIGGGVIGVEFATIFSSMGTKVTVIEAMDRILPTMDKEIAQNLNMILKKRGVSINSRSMV
ncbi:MAG TPA: FAD-dependent oxidoreductase, partial [Candidatus Merdenecus merdavium]|nr:FAD-dependent oxidoreductase [Candidatus Merdenecus merdavium]